MAYVSQELKAKLAPAIKAVCAKYGVKATVAVRNHSTLVLNIKSSKIDFIGNVNETLTERNRGVCKVSQPVEDNLQVNEYWYKEHFTGVAVYFLKEVYAAMNDGNFDNSDVQSDYFSVGWYTTVNIGQWNKPYIFEG